MPRDERAYLTDVIDSCAAIEIAVSGLDFSAYSASGSFALQVKPRRLSWEVLHPGAEHPRSIDASRSGGTFTLEVPLRRGCAVVVGRVRPSEV